MTISQLPQMSDVLSDISASGGTFMLPLYSQTLSDKVNRTAQFI